MIQEFSVQNFLSFREKQTISFVASSDKTLLDELTVVTKLSGIRLLRMSMIYGANASGKSNLLLAIKALWTLLFTPRSEEHNETIIYQPFELLKGKPTRFEIIFWANDRRFEYKLEYDKQSILYEKMEYTSDGGVLSLMYEREKGKSVKFGGTLEIKVQASRDLNRETLGNHTVLSTLNKKNIDVPQVMKELYEWIKKHVQEGDTYANENIIAEQAEKNEILKKLILELLNKADFHITDFRIVEISLPEVLSQTMRNDDEFARFIKPYIRRQILFTHEAESNNFLINFESESAGTKAYFRLARVMFDLKGNGYVLLEDELEDSLHYDLLIHYLKTYLQTESRSQLLFTTHNQLLLNEDWMIRRDMVWFAEKDRKTASTILSRASDMGIHKNVSLMNAYRVGKLGAKPVLGSTLLNHDGE
jgi:AAA15 family ATPase/GTPase